MAQDFSSAFGLGESSTSITTVDADGVLFAAVQELAKENERLKQALREQAENFEQRLAKLETAAMPVTQQAIR